MKNIHKNLQLSFCFFRCRKSTRYRFRTFALFNRFSLKRVQIFRGLSKRLQLFHLSIESIFW